MFKRVTVTITYAYCLVSLTCTTVKPSMSNPPRYGNCRFQLTSNTVKFYVRALNKRVVLDRYAIPRQFKVLHKRAWVASENRYLSYQVEGGVARGSHTCKKFAGRMWSGGAREHYASQISDRKLP